MPQPEAALRWVVKAHIDDNVCKPCKANDGKLYRNRQAAYRDYPNGKGYKHCVGAEYGNDCRCKVVKRSANNGEVPVDIGEIVNQYRTLSNRSGEAPRPMPKASLKMETASTGGTDLYIYDAIGGWFGVDPMDVINALAGATGDLRVHINSPGGGIFDGAAIYQAIKTYAGGKKTSIIEGVAASAASFIALAADEVLTTELGVMMVHDGSGYVGGTADDLRDMADLLDMLSDNIAGVYARKAGGTAAEWRDRMREGDTWMNAEQQIAEGLADRIGTGALPDEPIPTPEPEPAPAPDDSSTTPPIDFEGLRLALKGALAS
ncbi:MAG: head maturation protease, ClpP-related [Jiangellaceae bacterium]